MDRDSLVDVGLGLISRFGTRALNLTSVASHAGVARATAYRMFGGRSAFVDAIVEREGVLMREKFVAWGAGEDDPARRIHLRVTGALAYIREHGALNYVLAHEPDQVAGALISVGYIDRPSMIDRVVDAVMPELSEEDLAILRPNPRAGVEIIVRAVYTFVFVPQTSMTDDEIADGVVRAVTQN